MPGGILIFGANGAGKSTLGRELADVLNYKYMDIEDYHFIKSEMPYTAHRSREDCVNLMAAHMDQFGSFVLSSVTGDFGRRITSKFDLAVCMWAPAEIRIDRVNRRAYGQYGERVQKGGDMYGQHLKFMEFVASRPLTDIEQWAETLLCPVLHIDGTRPVSENVERIARQYLSVYR